MPPKVQGGGKVPRWEPEPSVEARQFDIEVDKRKGPLSLKLTKDFKVESIDDLGLVGNWNKKFPLLATVPGDEVVGVNSVTKERGGIAAMAAAIRDAKDLVKLTIRRSYTKYEYGWFMNVTNTGGGLGVSLETSRAGLRITRIDSGGAIAEWNEDNPLCQVEVGDLILQVNGKSPQRQGLPIIQAEVQKPGAMQLRIRRPERFTHVAMLDKSTGDRLGIRFNSESLAVERVDEGGLAFKWNRSHKGYPISPGDRLVEVFSSNVAQIGVNGIVAILQSVSTELPLRFLFKDGPTSAALQSGSASARPSPAPGAAATAAAGSADGACAAPSGEGRPPPRIEPARTQKPIVRMLSWKALLKRKDGPALGVVLGEDGEVVEYQRKGRVLVWNTSNFACPILPDDLITDAGVTSCEDDGADAMIDELTKEEDVRIRVVREGAYTFPVEIVRRSDGSKLGLAFDKSTLTISHISPDGWVAQWNKLNPELAVRIGDKLWQVQGKTVAELGGVGFLNALRSQRDVMRLRICRENLTKEQAEALLAAANRVRRAAAASGAQVYDDGPDGLFGGFTNAEHLDFDVSVRDFYRRLWTPYGPDTGPGARTVDPGSTMNRNHMARNSHFACPCCHRLFHVYIAEGRYRAVVAEGGRNQDVAVQFALQQDWASLQQRLGNL